MTQPNLVLIIEDAPEIAQIFAEILQSEGMSTKIINDGAIALKTILEVNPKLVLLDMHLPNVSGQEILSEIRALPHLASTRIVAVTADALLAKDLEERADLVLIKPVTFEQVSALSKRMIMAGTS